MSSKNTVITTHAKKGKPKAKKHTKPAHTVTIKRVKNGFHTMAHYPMETEGAADSPMGGYQEPEENVFSGATAHKDAFAHAQSAMPNDLAAEPDGDEGTGGAGDADGDEE